MADFRITVTVDPTGAQRGTKKVEQSIERVSRAADRARAVISRAFAFVGLGAGLTAGVRLLADFEQTLSTVRAVTGATETQFKALREEAQRLGATTRFSASEAGEGLLFLARAGFSVEESLQAVEGTLQLAQAGALDLGSAADIASNVLSGFRLTTDETTRVVDVLAFTANNANTNIQQLGDAMKFVAPVAAGLGVDIEEASAAIGVLSNNGLQASLAGTGLRRILSELESPAKKSRDILASLGLTAADVQVSQVGLTTAIQRLAAAGIDTGQALEFFGDRGGPAFEVLASSIGDVQELSGALEGAGGTAERIAKIMDDNLNGALLAVKSAFEGVILAIGDSGATSALTGFFALIAEGLRGVITNIDTFINVVEAAGIALSVNFARQAIPAAISAVKAFSVAIAANPLGALATAVTVAVSAFIAFSDQLSLTSDGAASVFDFLIVGFGRVVDLFTSGIESLLGLFGDFETGLSGIDFLTVVRNVATTVDAMVGLFSGAFSAIENLFENFPEVAGDLFISGLNELLGAANYFVRELTGILSKVPGLASVEISEAIPEITNPFAGAAEEVGKAALTGLVTGFDRRLARDLVDDIANEAEARAKERVEAASGTGSGSASIPGAPNPQSELTERLNAGEGRSVAGIKEINDVLQEQLRTLDEEATLLRLAGDDRDVLAAKLSLEAERRRELKSANEELSDSQLDALSKLSEAEASQVESAVRRNASLERQASLLAEIRGPQIEFTQGVQALDVLLSEGSITIDEYNAKLREFQDASLAAGTDAEAGFARGLNAIADKSLTTADIIEQSMVGAFDAATDAIVNFATTGETNFREFASSLSQQLLKLATSQLLTQLVGAFGGGTGGAAVGLGSALGGLAAGGGGQQGGGGGGGGFGFQNGGQFTVGGAGGPDSQLVQFKATPGEVVDVKTPGQMKNDAAPAAAPEVNVKVVNSTDPGAALDAMGSVAGERVIMNVIERNSRAISRSLSR